MKKLLAMLLCLTMLVTCFSAVGVSAAETGRIVRQWHMEPNGGTVTWLGLVCSAINQNSEPVSTGLSSGNLIENKTGAAVGIDGSGAASYKSLSYQTKSYMGLLDYQVQADQYVKPGHTYFKSAMMRLNPDATDDTTKASGMNIWTFHELNTKGFASDAAGFKSALDAYDGTSNTPNYDWGGVKAGTVKANINTDWVRVTDSLYVGTDLASATRDRAGWVIWGKDWSNQYWTGKWELIVDDYILIEVPNSDMLSVVYPVAYGATITSDGNKAEGGKLTAAAEYYDVNPLAAPTLSYKWQKSTDEKNWTDIEGATTAEYTLTADDADADKGICIRVVATASSKNSADETVTYSAYSAPFSVSTESKIMSVKLNSSSFMADAKAKIDAVILRESNVTAKNYVWQWSDDGKEWTAIEGQTADEYTVTPDVEGKLIRGGLSITTAEGTSEFVYTEGAKILGADDEFVFYVDGKSDGNGSVENPYSTLEEARDAARALRTEGIENPVVVYIRGGEYYRENQFALDEKDKNVTFRNYPGEEVLITGGKKVAGEHITKVTDEAVLNKIIDPKARERLYQIDLSGYVDSLEHPYEWSSALSGWDETMFANHLRVVVNGSGLDKSRWPNTTEAELVTQNMSNPNQGVATFRYADSSNRAKLWSEESIANLMIRGHFQYHWTYALQYATVDPATRTVTTRNATKGAWTDNQGFYFMNLIEEIDMPGESYTDVENKIVYFYGYGDMENPEVYVPANKQRLVSLTKANNITFKGIDFAHTMSKIIDGYGMSGLTLDDCSFSHFGARNFLYGDHITVKNCYWYGNAVAMLDIRDFNSTYPGNASWIRKQTESAENVFENNKFNLGNSVKLYSSPAVGSSQSKEMVIRNNEFYNSAGNALGIGTSIDTLITKNYFHDCVNWTSDMGAIYWNTNAGAFGHEISYNFFENNSSSYGDGWSQSIFYDDCSTGPWIHHNVFNQGTLGTSEGGQRYATKGFGGQFATVENNVFIDTPYGSQFQTWYPYESDGKQTGWWLNMYGKTKDGNTGSGYTEAVWKGNEVLISDSRWAEYYAGTPWEGYFDYVNKEYYNMVKDLDRNEDADALMELAKKYAPTATNVFRNNAMVGSKSTTIGVDPTYSNGREENTFFAPMSDADKLFTVYENAEFGITEDGLAAIKEKATGFEGFGLTDVGVQVFESDGETKTVGGSYAEAKNAEIKLKDGYATPVYDFYDADGEGEGRTTVVWYSSNKADGDYEVIPYGGTYDLPVYDYEGKYIKCVISVYDQSGVDGIEAETAPVLVREKANAAKTELAADITEAEALAAAAVVGTEKGQYTEKNMNNFLEAIAAAKAVIEDAAASETEVKAAVEDLAKAVSKFEKAANKIDSSVDEDSSDNDILPSVPSYGGSGGGGGGGSSSSGSKVTYNGTKENTTPSASGTTSPDDSAESKLDAKFTDIIGHWAEKDILSMNEKGIVSGVTDSTFEPDRAITRAEFATLIVKALKLEAAASDDFSDVSAADWFAPYVGAAAKAGIIVGSDGMFRPDDNITREEMAVIISKTYDYLKLPEVSGDIDKFTDAESISEWAVQFVGKVTAAGLISGMDDGSFAPKSNTTRAQAASVLARLFS